MSLGEDPCNLAYNCGVTDPVEIFDLGQPCSVCVHRWPRAGFMSLRDYLFTCHSLRLRK